jgi:predicted transcriptional regulator
MTTLTVELPEELSADLERMSSEEHKAIQDIVRESIRRYVTLERFHSLCGEIQPLAKAEGFLTDDDVFRAIS